MKFQMGDPALPFAGAEASPVRAAPARSLELKPAELKRRDFNQLHDELVADGVTAEHVELDQDGTIRLTFATEADREAARALVDQVDLMHKPRPRPARPATRAELAAELETATTVAAVKRVLGKVLERLPY